MRALPCRGSSAPRFAATVAAAATALAAVDARAKPARRPETVATEDEPGRPEADAEVSSLGRVTYAAASVGVPVSSRLELVPSAELFYLSPVDADPQSELHPYIGAGVAGEEPGDWDWELGLTYGPRAAGVSSVGASAAVSKGLRFGSDAPGPPPTGPDLRMDLSLNATVFSWRGPLFAGTSVTQVYAESHVRARLPHHLALRGQGMFFLYNPSLALRTAEAIDAFGILARVGTYAPRALGGVRLIWKATGTVAPLIQADEIVYAAGVGTATQVAAGFRLEMAPVLWATLVGGFLHNVLSGVASTLDDARTVPLVDVTVSVAF